ncbi:hypothetical protein CPB84DRAFT_1847210 [Gymnopilus junonius]|uniref:Uncharacterized protein n=1 Tax=Gymnopilus junonius TaxID=109634 RepID=A0A9P5NMZ8_GYMJU|nr:hypothetical protein CPB84DRAFT_1847210 [Gymnopilus junonius]
MTWFSWSSYKRLLPTHDNTYNGPGGDGGLFFVNPARKWELLYHRNTYYRIVVGSQLLSILLAALGFTSTSSSDKNSSALQSILLHRWIILSWAYLFSCNFLHRRILLYRYTKPYLHLTLVEFQADSGWEEYCFVPLYYVFPRRHISFTATLFILFVPDLPEPGDIKRLFVTSIILLWFVSTTATFMSSWITKAAAVQARGSELVVVGPPRTVPAWTVASSLESESL